MKFFSFCHKTWQPRGALSQFGALLYCLIACIGSDRRGVSVPAWGSSYPDSLFGPWHALFSNNFFVLHTGFFIGRVWEINGGGEVNKGGFRGKPFTSLHVFSNSLAGCWVMSQLHSVSSVNVFWGCSLFMWAVSVFFISSCRSQTERDVPNICTKVRTHETKCLCVFIRD